MTKQKLLFIKTTKMFIKVPDVEYQSKVIKYLQEDDEVEGENIVTADVGD